MHDAEFCCERERVCVKSQCKGAAFDLYDRGRRITHHPAGLISPSTAASAVVAATHHLPEMHSAIRSTQQPLWPLQSEPRLPVESMPTLSQLLIPIHTIIVTQTAFFQEQYYSALLFVSGSFTASVSFRKPNWPSSSLVSEWYWTRAVGSEASQPQRAH